MNLSHNLFLTLMQQPDQLNIDSTSFDSQQYVRHFLKHNSVQDLIKRHNDLQNEVKDYDQEIQSLVFENYSKFISSIDTVKKMKTDISKVEQKMSSLSNSMSRIASLSKKIDSAISVKRDEIIKLDTVNKDLSKLNNVCNFPHIIQKELDEYYKQKGASKAAINFDDFFNDTAVYYKQCFQMLETYQKEPLILPIHKESTQRLEQVRQILWSALMEFKQQNPLLQLYQHESKGVTISTQEARSAVKKLIYIMEDEEAVIKHYQKIIKERYLAITKELIDKATVSKLIQSGGEALNQIDVDLMTYLEEKKFEYTIEELEEFKQRKEKEYVTNDATVQGSILWLINQLCQIIFKELKVEVNFLLIEVKAVLRDKSHESVAEQCIKEIIHGVFQGVTEKMSQKKINNIQVNEVFKKLQIELVSLFQQSQNIRPQLRTEILDKFSENVENICRGQVLTSFSSLRMQFLEVLQATRGKLRKQQQAVMEKMSDINTDVGEVEGEAKREVMNEITNVKSKLLAQVMIRLIDLKAFVFQQQESYLREQQTYLHLIQASLIDFCKFISRVLSVKPSGLSQEFISQFAFPMISQQDSKDKLYLQAQTVQSYLLENDSSYSYIFTNQFLQLYQKTLLPRIVSLMSDIFPGCGLRNVSESELSKLQQIIQIGFKKNLVLFSQNQAEEWIRKYFTYILSNDADQPEHNVEQITGTTATFTLATKMLLLNLAMLFPDQKRGLVKKQSICKQEGGLNIQMEMVMVRKCRAIEVQITSFKKYDYIEDSEAVTRSQIIQTVVKYFLKMLLERVKRNPVIQLPVLKQFQIDIYFVMQILYDLVSVDEEGLIAGFFFEILDKVGQKCQEDQGKIDWRAVEVLSNQMRSTQKL